MGLRVESKGLLSAVGPGIVLAATGVGAGDLVAASVAGSRYGYALVWAALLGAALKFTLNEGLARWQLASGQTLLEGWATRIGRWFVGLFLAYLLLWSLVVAGALMAATGLAAHALVPSLSLESWGALHAVVAALLVWFGSYQPFERLVKLFVGLMVGTLVGCALFVAPPQQTIVQSVTRAAIPRGAVPFVLSVIGGVGGSVTLLSYGYWIRERGWRGLARLPQVRVDLAVAYGLTGLLGVAVIVLAAVVLHSDGVTVEGSRGVLQMAEMLTAPLGSGGRGLFLVGFWGAVTTSMLGVWQGVPYLFADVVRLLRSDPRPAGRPEVDPRSGAYRGFLIYLAGPPMALLAFDRPVALIIAYSVIGALFMPCLAGSLLLLNGPRGGLVPGARNGTSARAALAFCLVLFVALGVMELARRVG